MALSAETSASALPSRALGAIAKPRWPSAATSRTRSRLDARERRRARGQSGEEALDVRGRAFDLELDAVAVVAHEPGHAVLLGQAEDRRAEADALDDAVDPHRDAPCRDRRHGAATGSSISSRSTCQAEACASWMRGMCSERVTSTWSARPSAAIRPPS